MFVSTSQGFDWPSGELSDLERTRFAFDSEDPEICSLASIWYGVLNHPLNTGCVPEGILAQAVEFCGMMRK